MNIIDAINSGLPYRRKSWTTWYTKDSQYFANADVLATDWETQAIVQTFTAAQYWAAANSMSGSKTGIEALAKILGLPKT